MDKLKKFERDIVKLSAIEKRAVKRSLEKAMQIRNRKASETMTEGIADIVAASARNAAKRKSDKQTDADRRILIGARVRREDADRYRTACGVSRRSMYRFVVDALEAEYAAVCEKAPYAFR